MAKNKSLSKYLHYYCNYDANFITLKLSVCYSICNFEVYWKCKTFLHLFNFEE